METFALPPILTDAAPEAILMSLIVGVVWAIITGKLAPKSQLDYREQLVDKAVISSESWKSAYVSETRHNAALMRIVADIVGGETAATKLIATLKDKVDDTPSKGGAS